MTSITTSVGTLDVQSIVSQLMNVEQQPLTDSQNRVSTYNSQLSDVGKISSALSSLQTAVTPLLTGSFLQTFKASSTDTTIATVTTTTGGVGGSYALNVTQLAQSKQLVFDQDSSGNPIADPTAQLSGTPTSLAFSVAGTTTTVDLSSSKSLQDIANKINSSNAGVSATVVQNSGNYKLVLASTSSGTSNAFQMSANGGTASDSIPGLGQSGTAATSNTPATGAYAESHAALDAQLTVNGVSVSSGSNHLTNVVTGANIDISKVGSATITMSQDTAGIASALQSFVDAYNQVKSSTDSAYSGSMKGNLSVLSVQQQLSSLMQTPVAGVDPFNSFAYLSQVGISLQKDGTLKLDQTAFNQALTTNPSAVTNLFGNSSNTGFGNRINTLVNNMLGPNGFIETSKSSINSRISYENDLQTNLNSKLAAMKAQYTQQYTNLNAMLTQMQQATSSLSNLLS